VVGCENTPKGKHKSVTMPLYLWKWLEEYRRRRSLRSIAQAIERVINETGDNPWKYEQLLPPEGERA